MLIFNYFHIYKNNYRNTIILIFNYFHINKNNHRSTIRLAFKYLSTCIYNCKTRIKLAFINSSTHKNIISMIIIFIISIIFRLFFKSFEINLFIQSDLLYYLLSITDIPISYFVKNFIDFFDIPDVKLSSRKSLFKSCFKDKKQGLKYLNKYLNTPFLNNNNRMKGFFDKHKMTMAGHGLNLDSSIKSSNIEPLLLIC